MRRVSGIWLVVVLLGMMGVALWWLLVYQITVAPVKILPLALPQAETDNVVSEQRLSITVLIPRSKSRRSLFEEKNR